MNIMFSILFLIFFSISVSSQTSCTPKYSLGQLHSDKINIYSFRTVRSNQQSSDYPYQFNVSTFSKPPAVIFSIHTFSIESFSSINYKLSANVINNKVLFIFRSVDMRWKYFEINFILTSRNDLHYNIQTIDNFQKSGNSINSIDITKLPYYTPNKNYIFVHFIVGIISTFAKSYKYEVTPFDIAPDKYTIKAFSLTKASITVQTVYFQSVETQFSYSFNKYSFVSSQKNQYRSLWTEFSPLRYYLIGFNMINFEKQMAAITTSLDTSNSVLQISNWKGLKESHMIYLAIGDKSAQICAPCNNYVAIDKCLDKCSANQYAYDLLDGGKTCRQCSSNQGQILNKQQNSCLCNNNQKYYQGNCYDSTKLVICKPDQILINNNCQNKIVKVQVLKCDAQGQYLNKQKNICMCLSGYQRFQGACLNYCPKKSYRNSGGICVCNPGYMLNGLRQCQSVCPQFSNFILQLGQCVCIQNYQMKGSRCLKCNENQAYNQVQKKCVEKIVFNAISTINCEPNQTVLNGLCVCDHRSIKLNDKCVKCQGSSVKIDNKCVACPQNCASCSSFNLCTQCKSGFYLNYEYSCEQICGDGRRFTLPCDDGNNINGDGCSAICQREDGFSCNGGNASTRDICQLIDQNKKKLSLSLAQNGPFYLSPGIMTLFIINPPIKRSNADLSKLFTVNIVEKKFKPSNVFVHQDDKDLSQIRVFLEYKSSLPNGIFSASFKISQNNQEDSLNIMYNTIANSITSAISFINNKQSILT